jgi:hypothetical protein
MPSYKKTALNSDMRAVSKNIKMKRRYTALLVNHGYGSFHSGMNAAEVIETLLRSRLPRVPDIDISRSPGIQRISYVVCNNVLIDPDNRIARADSKLRRLKLHPADDNRINF